AADRRKDYGVRRFVHGGVDDCRWGARRLRADLSLGVSSLFCSTLVWHGAWIGSGGSRGLYVELFLVAPAGLGNEQADSPQIAEGKRATIRPLPPTLSPRGEGGVETTTRLLAKLLASGRAFQHALMEHADFDLAVAVPIADDRPIARFAELDHAIFRIE